MIIKMKFFTILLSLFLISCVHKEQTNKSKTINKEFIGLWAETSWTYKFNPDRSFTFKTEGHYDFSTDSGVYCILDSLIFLAPKTDWKVFDGVLKTKLKIINDDCLRDYDNNFYCTSIDTMNNLNEKEWIFKEKTIKILDSLPLIKNTKKNIPKSKSAIDFEPKIVYNGIIVVEKVEFHAFKLEKYDDDVYYIRTYLLLLVKKDPFEIYQHDLKGNSLSLIYREE